MKKLVTKIKDGLNSIMATLTVATTSLFTAMFAAPVLAEDNGTSSGIFDTIKYDGNETTASNNDISGAGTTVGDLATKIYWIIVGVSVVICLIFFVFKAVKLAKSGDNPSERSKAVGGLITAIIAVALIGSAATIAGWAFGIF